MRIPPWNKTRPWISASTASKSCKLTYISVLQEVAMMLLYYSELKSEKLQSYYPATVFHQQNNETKEKIILCLGNQKALSL